MSEETTRYAHDPVVLAEVPCPDPECDAQIPIRASLLVEVEEIDGVTAFRLGTYMDSNAIELHMVEHGLDPRPIGGDDE